MAVLEAKVIAVGEKSIELFPKYGKRFKVGADVIVMERIAYRTTKQNSLYFEMLDWVVRNHGREIGFFSTAALHENIKAFIVSQGYTELMDDMKGQLVEEFSTALVSKGKWELFLNIISNDLFLEVLGMSLEPFWEEYKRMV